MSESFEQWGIVELMGHVRVAGKVTEEEHFGSKMGRIDIPDGREGFTTQWFGGSSVYRLTPTTEAIARAVAAKSQPEPVYQWELPPARGKRPDPEDELSQAAEYSLDPDDEEP